MNHKRSSILRKIHPVYFFFNCKFSFPLSSTKIPQLNIFIQVYCNQVFYWVKLHGNLKRLQTKPNLVKKTIRNRAQQTASGDTPNLHTIACCNCDAIPR